MNKRMKQLLILCLSLIVFSGCKKDEPINICNSLLKQGTADKTQLLGQWNFAAFAYTVDGGNIKNETVIHGCNEWNGPDNINIIDSINIICKYNNEFYYKYLLSNSNNIKLIPGATTKKNYACQEEELKIALDNAECYVVKGKQLFIHYKEQNKKNILILNKNE